MKCRALSQIAECESELNHVDEAERLFLQCAEILMESTLHATDYGDIAPLIYALLSLNDDDLDQAAGGVYSIPGILPDPTTVL